MGVTEHLYRKAPVWLQNLLVSGYGAYWHWVRFGPGFGRALRGFRARERFDAAEWEAWVQARLRRVLNSAVDSVPFYQDAWGPEHKRAAREGHLEGLPVLDKESLRRAPLLFARGGHRRVGTLTHFTSGSTGTPISCYWTVAEYRAALALREARSAGWAGVSFRQPRATFSGRLVEPDPDSRGPFYRFNMVERQVYFSAFHLRPEHAKAYVDALRRHRIEWGTGYAMSWYMLASMVLEQGLEVKRLKAIVTTSEKVTPEMRTTMERAFGCPVFEEYSTVENALFASECEHHRLHVSPDAGIVEILREDGTPCPPGEVGEVVATCLLRSFQPLIRYRLGDLAAWSGTPCPCGRAMPVLEEVVGRVEDVVIGPDGRKMVRFHGLYLGLPGIRRGQVVQEAIDRIRVLIETTSGFDDRVVTEIKRRVHERLGLAMHVDVEPVDEIPLGPRGKFQAVVSRLKQ